MYSHSVVELAQEGASGLSVLRTFRLLRILKLVRFMPALQYQLVVMLKTMDSVATFCALLVLFIFIFRSAQHHLTLVGRVEMTTESRCRLWRCTSDLLSINTCA